MEIVGERNAQRPSRAGSSYMFLVHFYTYVVTCTSQVLVCILLYVVMCLYSTIHEDQPYHGNSHPISPSLLKSDGG